MKRLLILLFLLLGSATIASARDSVKGWCEQGNQPVKTSGLNSTTRVQASHPSCQITVVVHGGALATIFADNNGTPLANPFTAESGGRWQAYADNGRYDVVMSSAGFTQTVTYSDIILCDPFATGSTCNNGGTTQGHNILSTTHLDSIPASAIQGDLITAQAQTSPTGVTPSWARLPVGTAGQLLLSSGTDPFWGNITGGTGITITNSSSTITISNSGVLSVHHGLSFTVGDPGNVSAITPSSTATAYMTIPFNCTINAYNLAIDAGTVTVKFWKIATGTAIPTVANSINTSGVGISSGTAIHSTTLSDFTTTTITANDIMAMNVTAATTVRAVNGVLACTE